MGEAVRRLEDVADLERDTAAQLAAIGQRAGVRVTEVELRAAVDGMSPETLRSLPRQYETLIEDLQGVDLNDPSVWDDEGGLPLDDAIEQGLL